MILPTTTNFGFTAAKGLTLGDFGKYLLCQGQTQVDALGYSALPINLVEAGFAQLQKIPGANIPTATAAIIKSCDNPTFSTNGTNTLADNDPQPAACDKKGPTQCATGTGGDKTTTPVKTTTPGQTSGVGPAAAGGVTPGASSAPGATTGGGIASACDPDSGSCTPADGSADSASGQQVDGVPVAESSSLGDGMRTSLMVIAAALLLALCLLPPLIAQGFAARRGRHDGSGGAR